jgi:hypothetical protein
VREIAKTSEATSLAFQIAYVGHPIWADFPPIGCYSTLSPIGNWELEVAMENTILLALFVSGLFCLFGLDDAFVALKNWYFRKPANVTYWSAYERN